MSYNTVQQEIESIHKEISRIEVVCELNEKLIDKSINPRKLCKDFLDEIEAKIKKAKAEHVVLIEEVRQLKERQKAGRSIESGLKNQVVQAENNINKLKKDKKTLEDKKKHLAAELAKNNILNFGHE